MDVRESVDSAADMTDWLSSSAVACSKDGADNVENCLKCVRRLIKRRASLWVALIVVLGIFCDKSGDDGMIFG